ncbi:MAG TPA: hypothetical protein EYH02_01605 [Ignisphaera aggregans]|uniref:Uncharacterized protein n=1 Tax=Ignisphaera aggregans TaxID=334771 RepID=A0A832YXG0_9CREN|nr:hypothetical protein [Ignisphaera aggregans]
MSSLTSLLEKALQKRLRIAKVELITIERGDRWVYAFFSHEGGDVVQGRVIIEWREKPVVQHIDFT